MCIGNKLTSRYLLRLAVAVRKDTYYVTRYASLLLRNRLLSLYVSMHLVVCK